MNASISPRTTHSLWTLALVLTIVFGGTQALSWWRDAQAAQRIKSRLGTQRITLYTTQSCFYCTKAKSWLRGHQITWDECDVERDLSCKATFEAHGAPGTPVVRVGQHWHLGFDPAWIAEALHAPEPVAPQPRPNADTSPRP